MADARRRCAARHPDDLAELHRWARSAQLPAVLVQRARIQLHFTPTSASWLTLVEVFSSIVEC